MKYILIIGDGMAENPLKALGGLTPLQKANIPVMDSLAMMGVHGSVKTVPDGFSPGSDTAIMSIFGCSPKKYYSGRAPLEAAAQGIKIAPGSLAMRCNNITLSDGAPFRERTIVSHSAGGIGGKEASELITWLFDNPEFGESARRAGMEVKPCDSYRHIVVQRNADINGLEMIPPHDHLDEKVADNLPAGCPNAEVLTGLMETANRLLDYHPINKARRAAGKLPANAIWFWAAGTAPSLPDFKDQYGKTGTVISAVPLVQGIARLIGLDVIQVQGATGEVDTNYEGKTAAALDALSTDDFVAVHLEGPDECSHNGDLDGKLQAIEWLDSRIVSPLISGLKEMGSDFRMLILSDHKTLMVERIHDADPVPYIFYDSRMNTGANLPFSEENGEKGPLLVDGAALMDILFEK